MRVSTQNAQDYPIFARQLIRNLAQDATSNTPSSAMSTCIYDTAWVSMVAKRSGGQVQWLIPDSFEYIIRTQNECGSWKDSDESELDGILNTMAALLACIKHQNPEIDSPKRPSQSKISSGIIRATTWLQTALGDIDLQSCDQVAFELLVPALLDLLRSHGVDLVLRDLDRLLLLRDKKLSKLDFSSLYQGTQSTIAHCLEALVGKIDFDRLNPLLRNGSMMGSPSATAAYLIYCSNWNDTAEEYLLSVFERGAGMGSGAFPSAFPAEIFETSWVLSTLLEVGVMQDDYNHEDLQALGRMLKNSLQESDGVVGFSSSMLADADDTSKSLYSLHLLNQNFSCDALVRHFGHHKNFRTYAIERNPSISANCNVIKVLVHSNDRNKYSALLGEALNYVCESWLDGKFDDKWNLSPIYSHMLLGQTLAKVLSLHINGEYTKLPKLLLDKMQMIVTQLVGNTIRRQSRDGAWGSKSCEITAYAILLLTTLVSLPQCQSIQPEIIDSVLRGRQYLMDRTGNWKPSRIWIEKITYSSPVLTNAYCLAALYASERLTLKPLLVPGHMDDKTLELTKFFGSLPMFHHLETKALIMKTSMLEAQSLLPKLERVEHDIFPPGTTNDNKYLRYLPFTWVACNNSCGQPLSTNLLWDMIEISMLNFQADSYIETVVNNDFGTDLNSVRIIIDQLCGKTRLRTPQDEPQIESNTQGAKEGKRTCNGVCRSETIDRLQDVKRILGSYVDRIMSQPNVAKCSQSMQDQLRGEIAGYLQAQVTSVQDSQNLDNKQATSRSERPSLFRWARSTGADHTSCPYSYFYFTCLISGSNGQVDCFPTPIQKYSSQSLVRHLATMCRMHNDYGSYQRDKAEGNFSCFSCLELDEQRDSVHNGEKQQLLEIAEFERQGMQLAMSQLDASTPAKGVMDKIRLFTNVTDLYGQIYIARDIGVRST